LRAAEELGIDLAARRRAEERAAEAQAALVSSRALDPFQDEDEDEDLETDAELPTDLEVSETDPFAVGEDLGGLRVPSGDDDLLGGLTAEDEE